MRISDAQSVTHITSVDRREEFVAVAADLYPQFVARVETLTLFTMVAAFWGVIVYVALTMFALQ